MPPTQRTEAENEAGCLYEHDLFPQLTGFALGVTHTVALTRIAQAVESGTPVTARAATALERIACSLEKLEELPKRLRNLELVVQQQDLR